MKSQTSVREHYFTLPKSEWSDAEWQDMQNALDEADADALRQGGK